MRTHWRILSALLLIAALNGLFWITWVRTEPTYERRSLSYWLKEYENPRGSWKAAGEALKEIGTNAIPALLSRLQSRDNIATRKLYVLFGKQHWIANPIVPANIQQLNAAWAFHTLTELKIDLHTAVPKLIEIYDQKASPSSSGAAFLALTAIQEKEAIPFLFMLANDTTGTFQEGAALALSGNHFEPRLIIPALIKLLGNSNATVRMYAAHGFLNYGSAARDAIPALTLLCQDSDTSVRETAASTLRIITYQSLPAKPD